MYFESIIDQLEVDFGTSILSDLTGQNLTRNGQPVRLFDQTRNTSERYYRTDKQGKPYIQNFQEQKRYYPFTSYCRKYGLDSRTAIANLCQQYGLSFPGIEYANRTYHQPPYRLAPPRPPVVNQPNAVGVDYIPLEVYEPCQTHFGYNGLFVYFSALFGAETAQEIFSMYSLGTSRRWQFWDKLATCLPQFDKAGNLRQIKIVSFHPVSGRRAKKHDPACEWNKKKECYEVSSGDKSKILGREIWGNYNANLVQCFFGEHLLLLFPDKPIALVEGESTALVMSVIWPEYIWLATGGCSGCGWNKPDTFNALQGRNVTLWPDSGKFADWSAIAESLRGIAASLTVSPFVEINAPAPNLDLRDLLSWQRLVLDGQTYYAEELPPVTTQTGNYSAELFAPLHHDTECGLVRCIPTIQALNPKEFNQKYPNFRILG